MNEFCKKMDEIKATSYLETDKEINVSFYTKFGFEVVSREMVLGVPNWFMIRMPPG